MDVRAYKRAQKLLDSIRGYLLANNNSTSPFAMAQAISPTRAQGGTPSRESLEPKGKSDN